jgi:hypothetical protein
MRRSKILLIASLCLLNFGCVFFHPESLKTDTDGYYIKHFHSCGPRALKKAFNELNVRVTEKELSKQIQSSGNLTRVLLTLIHHDTIRVTLPSEIKSVCLDYGYEVSSVKSLEELDPEKDIAIILVSGNILKGETHWLCFPTDKYIKNYFGKNTKISKIYLLEKIN